MVSYPEEQLDDYSRSIAHSEMDITIRQVGKSSRRDLYTGL
jgi:hypothetical protein